MKCLDTFLKNQVAMCGSVLLIYLEYCSFLISLDIMYSVSPPNFFFFKIVFVVLIPLSFHLRISLLIKTGKLARIFIRHFKVLLWYNTRFTESSKINVKGHIYHLHLISLFDNILHIYSTISRPANWHWCNPQSLFRFYSYMDIHLCDYVCVFIIMCNFITCVGGLNYHHHQDTELFHHYKDPPTTCL